MRNNYFDVLKAIAIIAVVLYHLGVCQHGYLGVDIFFVIAGYFTSKSIDKQIAIRGGYLLYVNNRLIRLWPLQLIASIVVLLWGWTLMLPDDFENVAQSIIATNFFSNNILQAVTTKNYWDVANDYKPLMHTWYVGVLLQYYIVVSSTLFALGYFMKDTNKRKRLSIWIFFLFGLASLMLYLISQNDAQKFYYLPFRFYEFCAGGLMFYLFGGQQKGVVNNMKQNILFLFLYMIVIVLLFANLDVISKSVRLLIIVGLTSLLIILMPRVQWAQVGLFSNKWVASIGAASFSIFVWHQVVFALMRYSFTNKLTAAFPLFSVTTIIIILSILSYHYVEKMKTTKQMWIITVLLLVLTTVCSLDIYNHAGVIRNVPELDVIKGDEHRGMWAEYCDRGYQYDKEFAVEEKAKWYVIGNSFGRDFVNVIVESAIIDRVDVVYSDMRTYQDKYDRFAQADVVFLSTLGVDEDTISEIRSLCSANSKFYIIGEKNFGESNGQIYRHRFDANFHQLTISMEEGYVEKNNRLKALYPECYVDLIAMVQQPDGKVRVFSDDGRFISQDCRHLTKAGARYYAGLIDWNQYFN